MTESIELINNYTKVPDIDIETGEVNNCSICLDELNDSVKILNCKHKLHKECLQELLNQKINKCPLCKTEIFLEKNIIYSFDCYCTIFTINAKTLRRQLNNCKCIISCTIVLFWVIMMLTCLIRVILNCDVFVCFNDPYL